MSGKHGGRRPNSMFNAPISKKSALLKHLPKNVVSTPIATFYDVAEVENEHTGKRYKLLERNRYEITHRGTRKQFDSLHDAEQYKTFLQDGYGETEVSIVMLPKVRVSIADLLER